MTSNVLCKYYMNGACAYGDQCRFSHSRQDEPSQVCKYYLAGNCAYGDRCRYMHSKPSWSSRGQPPPPSNYSAPAVPKPPTGDVSAPETGAPNWDDYMTPDEMDEFEQWQEEQQMKAQGEPEGGDDGDIMDPAEIPLCQEYAGTGQCSAGDDCLYIHGDECEICGYYCVHPYNPDWTAQHQAACKEHYYPAAAAANGTAADQQQQQRQQSDQPAIAIESSSSNVSAAADNGKVSDTAEAVKAAVAAAVAAVVADGEQDEEGAAVEDVAEKLAATDISS